MRAFLFVVLCGLALDALATGPATVLVLGDSLSAAHNIPLRAGWVRLLEERLGTTRRVVNASISGETTLSGRQRLPSLLEQYQPAVVVLELGANDGLQGMPLENIRANLADMVAACHKAGAKVLLLGIELPVNYGPRYRDGLRAIYADLARQYDTGLVPFLLEGVALKPELMQADGMHPTAAGERIVFGNVWQALAPMLAPTRETGLSSRTRDRDHGRSYGRCRVGACVQATWYREHGRSCATGAFRRHNSSASCIAIPQASAILAGSAPLRAIRCASS